MKFPNAGSLCLFAAIAIIAAGASSSRGNVLEASASMSSVSISITLNGATFPNSPGFNPTSAAEISGAIGGQGFPNSVAGAVIASGSLYTPHSVGPSQINDPASASSVQSSSSVSGALLNGSQTLNLTTGSFSGGTVAFTGGAFAQQGSDGFSQLPAFAQPVSATVAVDLMSDFGSNPASNYSVQTAALGSVASTHSAQTFLDVGITTNLPLDRGALFELSAIETLQNGVVSFDVQFSSPYSSQPIFASDFVAQPNGIYSLDPTKRQFSIPFTIPAGFALHFGATTATDVNIVPEPASYIPALFALIGLLGFARRRR